MLISKSKIHHINSMLITMLKFTSPNKNLFSMNAVPYFFYFFFIFLFKHILLTKFALRVSVVFVVCEITQRFCLPYVLRKTIP